MRPRVHYRGFMRHLDGWQAGAVVVVLAGSAILLGVPRGVAPEVVPAPHVNDEALSAAMAEDDRLAREAQDKTLDRDVRAVGDAFRAFNKAVVGDETAPVVHTRTELSRSTQAVIGKRPQELAALRAYHMTRFIEEVRRWEADGHVSQELTELSGDFVQALVRNQWCRNGKLLADERVLRVLFKKRWNDVTGVRGELFELSLDEDRLRHGFLLLHPFRSIADERAQQRSPATPDQAAQKARLTTIARLGQRDPDYPAELARGVIEYQRGRYGEAVTAFRAHLERHPDGPNTLRARNYLKAALDRAAESL